MPPGGRGELRRVGGSDIPLYWNRQCGLGGPGSVRVGEARKEETQSRVADIGGDPGGLDCGRTPGAWGSGRGGAVAREPCCGLTYVCSSG